MNYLEIKLDLEPISLNQSTFVWNNRKIKTNKHRTFEIMFSEKIGPYSYQLKQFKEAYNPFTQHIAIDYTFYIPKFFTSDNRVSRQSKDVDNMVKVVNDRLFKEIGVDDSQVTDLSARKRPLADFLIHIKLYTLEATTYKVLGF